jgi:hypothetical protein
VGPCRPNRRAWAAFFSRSGSGRVPAAGALAVILLGALAHPSPATAHGWYQGLRSPRGVECCNERDCRPVPHRFNAGNGREEIKAEGRWWPIHHDDVLTLPTPDGKAHACWSGPDSRPRFRCIILPGMARLDGPGATLAAVPAPGPSALEVLAAGR